jgi:hypothetical protein
MTSKSAKYTACHEAGHAVVAYQNGFTIRRVRLWRDPRLDRWSGCVEYEPSNWECPACKGRLVEAVLGEDFAQLNAECEQCRARVLSFTARCMAGGVATELFEIGEHDWSDSEFDRVEAFKCCAPDVNARSENYDRWLEHARLSVQCSRDAIKALQAKLVELSRDADQVELTGDEVVSIIGETNNA